MTEHDLHLALEAKRKPQSGQVRSKRCTIINRTCRCCLSTFYVSSDSAQTICDDCREALR